ncbi:hypothetical protein [Pontibacter oryzae]|nr:hypothetical protein [Pontibacter oryzae]
MTLRYEGVKPEAFEQLRAKLKTYGIDLSNQQGSFNEKGVSGTYNYSPEAEQLNLDDLKVGFPASMMISADKLQQRMDEIMVQHGARPQR